jgi:hypothetical protein
MPPALQPYHQTRAHMTPTPTAPAALLLLLLLLGWEMQHQLLLMLHLLLLGGSRLLGLASRPVAASAAGRP